MTTPTRTSSNKTALRASLKKEDESLAERLVATDIPLVSSPEPEAPIAAAPQVDAPVVSASARRTAAKPAAKPAAKSAVAVSPAPQVKATSAAKATQAKAEASVTAQTSVAKAKKGGKKAVAETKPIVSEKPAKPQNAAKLGAAVEKLEKAAKEKGDKLVRYSVELLKSEEAAIEALRAELSKAAGWAASKSDILRAGVRLFAEQKVEQMKELLAGLAAASKGSKGGSKKG